MNWLFFLGTIHWMDLLLAHFGLIRHQMIQVCLKGSEFLICLLVRSTFEFFRQQMIQVCLKWSEFLICLLDPFGAHDKNTWYDNTIISYLNFPFGASVGKDQINLLLILSYCSFVVLILNFWWVTWWENFATSFYFLQHLDIGCITSTISGFNGFNFYSL